jgi:arylsulfatase A-like enzyme
MDIYPTLIDMCNLPAYELLEGHSLKNLIQNPNTRWTHPALSFYGEGNIAIRDERLRLIRYEAGSVELYDMKKDPNEWCNLAIHKKYNSISQKLSEYIPKNWAPLSEYSQIKSNEYFIEKSKR